MNAARALGLLQELASVALTLLAAWIALPGGLRVTAPLLLALAGVAVAIGVLELVRQRLPGRQGQNERDRRGSRLPLPF